MLRNYLRVGIRNLLRQRLYSFVNIIGLAIGLCCFSLIILFVSDELTYDLHHEQAENVYRLDFSGQINDTEFITSLMSVPAARILSQDYSEEIESAFRFRQTGSFFVRTEDSEQNYKEKQVIYADSNLFSFWSIPVVYGNPEEALSSPKTLAINRSTSERLFGKINPVGKNLIINNKAQWKIGAVFEDIPDNSHFNYNIFLTMLSREEANATYWMSFNFSTYFRLYPNTDVDKLTEKMSARITNEYIGPEIKQFMNMDLDEFADQGNYMGYELFPLTDIHLKSNKLGELSANGDIRYVWIFSAIGIFILLLACVNFINLATARSMSRAREVGLRKVLGAYRGNLIFQFLLEAFLITACAALLSYMVIFLLLPVFNELSLKSFEAADLYKPQFLVLILSLTLIIAFIAGIYPAFYLSKFQPIKTLKGRISTDLKGGSFRNALVVFQFVISLIMIVGTLTINNQLSFIQNKKLGYDNERLVLIDDSWILRDDVEAFKNEVKKSTKIVNVSSAGFFPVDTDNSNNIYWPGNSAQPSETFIVSNHVVDYDFVPTLGLEIIEGRNFSETFNDDNSVIINEACARRMGLNNPIGEFISTHSDSDGEMSYESFKVVGVVKDFHFKSLREIIQPVALHQGKSKSYVCMKLSDQVKTSAAIDDIKVAWEKFATGQPMSYSFMDDRFNKLHKSENQIRKIMNVFAFIAILIACLGLFGLSSFIAAQKTKEIGIRKVLGASTQEIVRMLTFKFLKPVLIAFVFAIPISWYFMQKWLEDFAYRIDLDPLIFMLAGVLSILIAWMAMSYHSIKAANANPVDSIEQD